MGFDFPEALLLLLVLPPLLWVLRRGDARTRQMARILKSRPPRRWQAVCRLVLVCVFIGSLAAVGARPYREPDRTGDFVFLVDVSRSMTARHSCADATFLERSKRVMRQVLSGVPDGRFGVVAFDRYAFPITQMTFDHAYLNEAIDHGLFVGLFFEATATNIENALSVVARKKANLPDTYGKVKHVVLLSDGHVEGAYQRRFRQAFQDVLDADIQVLAVGIGNTGTTPIPRMEGGRCLNQFLQARGENIAIPLRDDILKLIAGETRGMYFGEGEVDALVRFLKDEGLSEVPEGTTFSQAQRRDIGSVFLLPATLALVGLLFLSAGVEFE
jgi:Ca-activated chloride channel family protein